MRFVVGELRAVEKNEMRALPPRIEGSISKFVDSQEVLLSFRVNTALTNYHDLLITTRGF
jgi:hypothetical protein